MKYYLANNGTPEGPYSVEQLRALNISKSTLVWNQELTSWTPAGNVPELNICFNEVPPAPPQMSDNGYNYSRQEPQHYGVCPKTWLVESILVTLFCCLPFGIVGIIKASHVESAYRAGNYAEAQRYSQEAGKWTKWSFILGIGITLLYVIIYVFSFSRTGYFE